MDFNKLPYQDTYEEVENEEESRKWLLWFNSDIFWEIPERLPEIMLEIFSRVPPKSLIRCKSISKNFDFMGEKYFISKHLDNMSLSGFFGPKPCSHNVVNTDDNPWFQFRRWETGWIQYQNLKSEFYSLPDPGLNFLLPKDKGYMVKLIDSCNGLLLCINIKPKPSWVLTNGDILISPKQREETDKTCFVCNPFTKEKVALPHYHRRSTRVNHALMADLDDNGYFKYKVVCLVRDKINDSGTKLLIFSSETGEWEEQMVDFPIMHNPNIMGSKVFFNGSLFWDCFETHILVCHFDKKKSGYSFELIEAPCAAVGRCLWKFHDKLLCYGYSYRGDFPAWLLSVNEFGLLEWKKEGCEMFETMSTDISRMDLENHLICAKVRNLPQVRFKIIAHDPLLNMVYFLLNDLIYSYRLGNREVSLVGRFDYDCYICRTTPDWKQKYESVTCVLPYKHSLGRIQIANAVKAKDEERGKDRLPETIAEKKVEPVKPTQRKRKVVKLKGSGHHWSRKRINFSLLPLDEE